MILIVLGMLVLCSCINGIVDLWVVFIIGFLVDMFGWVVNDLWVLLIDCCNLWCSYCMFE